jgi:hypothetical protein
MKKKKWLYLSVATLLIMIPILRIVILRVNGSLNPVDLAAYSAVSRALFEGNNPFPDHTEFLFTYLGEEVPIVYPGQMLLFALPAYIWGNTLQIIYILINIIVMFFLVALTLVKACGFQWSDFRTPGEKQLCYALCVFLCSVSTNNMTIIRTGQIVLILTLCLYGMFWGPRSNLLRICLFAFIAVTKYSILTVFAPILFFKGHWKLCIYSFCIFVLLSLSPVICGNNLVEVFQGYFKAVKILFQPGQCNHYDMCTLMCHLGFFKISIINHLLKIIVVGIILWLCWREWKNEYFSDTLLMLSLSLTMLISYHGFHDIVLIFPLFLIRLFDFVKTKQWFQFVGTLTFFVYCIIPGTILLHISSWIGKIPRIDSIIYLVNNPWGFKLQHVFPITPFFTIALTLWSLYLYLHVKEQYRFEIPASNKSVPPQKQD